MSNIVSRTLSVHQEHEFLLKLEIAGLSRGLAQRIIDLKGNDLAIKVVRLIQNDGFEPTTNQKRAREVMGKNFFGVEEAIKHFGINPTHQQIEVLSEIPFSEAVLRQLKNTHILVAVFPLSILEIRGKVEQELFNSKWDDLYNQSFAEERSEVAWQLICKTPVGNSEFKIWQEQQELIVEGNEVPSAHVMVYAIIGHCLANGERLFQRTSVRTTSVSSIGNHIALGYFSPDGLRIISEPNSSRRPSPPPHPRAGFLGIASARKP